MADNRQGALRIALVFTGIAFLLVYPLMTIWPSSTHWFSWIREPVRREVFEKWTSSLFPYSWQVSP